MAEKSPAIRNKGLLITAVIIAALVVIIYNWHIHQVRRAGEGETISVLAFKRNMEAGETIEPEDLVEQTVETNFAEGLGNVVKRSREEVSGRELNRGVTRGLFLRWDHILGHRKNRPSENIRKGMVAFTVAIQSEMSPGTVLSIGDKVALLGKLSVHGRPLTSYKIIEGVRVLAVGGVAGQADSLLGGKQSRMSSRAQRNYRSLTIEVDPETAVHLDNVLSHVTGSVRVVVLSPRDEYRRVNENPKVLEELRNLTASRKR